METVQAVKNGMHLKKSPDSQKIKKSFMKEQDNHGSQVRIKRIKNQNITFFMLDQDLNLLPKLVLITLLTKMLKIRNTFLTQELNTIMEKLHYHQ
jgi:hypothetical protein